LKQFWKAPLGIVLLVVAHVLAGLITQLAGLILVACPLVLLMILLRYFFA